MQLQKVWIYAIITALTNPFGSIITCSLKGGIFMKQKNLFSLIALVLIFTFALTACGGEKTAETSAPSQSASQEAAPLGLQDWTLTASTWSSPNGATVHLSATPVAYDDGQSAIFLVRLEGDEVAAADCQWNGSCYTASLDLNAEDGYCYYVLMTASDGNTAEIPVNLPAEPVNEALINMADALNTYCTLVISSTASADGRLTVQEGTATVQTPRITDDGQTITCSEVRLVLSNGGADVDSTPLTLEPDATAGVYTLALSNVSLTIPTGLEEDAELRLRLDVTLSNGQFLTAPGATLYYYDGTLLPAVG